MKPAPMITFVCSILLSVSCEHQPAYIQPETKSQASLLEEGLVITGDPEEQTGARWTYSENGTIVYDLQGTLFKPPGNGPFPAVVLNHGTSGSAFTYSSSIAKTMVKWGYVCIATNYTHSSNVPCGSPGSCVQGDGEWGASESNALRGLKSWQILVSLSYVDSTRIVSFGHSRGAFLTTALAGTHPDKFTAFAHTAGGVSDVPGATTPGKELAEKITKPYLIHHGDDDKVVDIALDRALSAILIGNSVPQQLHEYPRYSHSQISQDSLMFVRTRAWFEKYNQ
jgi:dienelactone hydrolase